MEVNTLGDARPLLRRGDDLLARSGRRSPSSGRRSRAGGTCNPASKKYERSTPVVAMAEAQHADFRNGAPVEGIAGGRARARARAAQVDLVRAAGRARRRRRRIRARKEACRHATCIVPCLATQICRRVNDKLGGDRGGGERAHRAEGSRVTVDERAEFPVCREGTSEYRQVDQGCASRRSGTA